MQVATVRSQYRRLALAVHPDKCQDGEGEVLTMKSPVEPEHPVEKGIYCVYINHTHTHIYIYINTKCLIPQIRGVCFSRSLSRLSPGSPRQGGSQDLVGKCWQVICLSMCLSFFRVIQWFHSVVEPRKGPFAPTAQAFQLLSEAFEQLSSETLQAQLLGATGRARPAPQGRGPAQARVKHFGGTGDRGMEGCKADP